MTISHSDLSEEEQNDNAARYYLGLWNLLKVEQVSPSVIINSAISNMTAILDYYMTDEQQLHMLKVILDKITEEKSLTTNDTH